MGKASIYLPILLTPAGSGEQEGTVWGLLSMKGQQQKHSSARDMLHVKEYRHNRYPRQAREFFRPKTWSLYQQSLTEIEFAIQDHASDLSRQISLLQLELLPELDAEEFLCLLIYLDQYTIHTQPLKKLYSNLKIQLSEPWNFLLLLITVR